jgi:two-component system chemotaxis response regulator CheB
LPDKISVLIVDDSALMRNIISKIIDASPGLCVADRAMNGSFALQKIPRCNPDVIVLDLELPEMNGIAFLHERKKLGIDIPVVILSSIARKGAEITMDALSLGASDFLKKPTGEPGEDVHSIGEQLTEMLFIYGSQYKAKKGKAPVIPPEHLPKAREETPHPRLDKPVEPEVRQPPTRLREVGKIELIAIGISTGGPNALREVFAKIDADLPQPIVVVQHMPVGFTYEFAKSLDRICPLEVKEAEDDDILKPGRILIAPGDRHMEVERRSLASVVKLSDSTQVNGHRPSVDVLFSSVARHYGNKAMGIIMTGMGRDGAKELGSIYREGGLTLGQDEASSIVYGMPKVAFEYGHVMEQVPLAKMAETISRLAKEHK